MTTNRNTFILVNMKNPDGALLFKVGELHRAVVYTDTGVYLHIGNTIYQVDMDLEGFYRLLDQIDKLDPSA
jgi:hypothetical protein